MTETSLDNLARAIECLLFTSSEPLSVSRLCEVLETDRDTLEQALERLKGMIAESGLQVMEMAGGYVLATKPEYASYIQRLLQPAPTRLSPQALETLAVIAYRQPMTRPEIDDIRGVNSQHAIATLVEKGLVTTVGRKDTVGRPLLYGTTPYFLTTFGLKDLRELPDIDRLREAAREEAPMVLYGVSQTGEDAQTDLQAEATVATREFSQESGEGGGAALQEGD